MKRTLPFASICILTAASLLGQYSPGQPSPEQQANREPAYGNGPENGPGADNANPDQVRPEQGVARVSLIQGDVSVRRGDSGEVSAASVNAPLMVQDRLLTASGARAEIQFDAGNVLRVASSSEVRLSGLQYGHYQIQVALGTVTFTVLRDSQAQTELDLPSVGLRPTRPGAYRVTVHEDGSAEITVRNGEAQVLTAGGTETVQAGSMMMVRGTGSNTEYQAVTAPAVDDWDRWNQERDGYFLRAQSPRHVNPDVYGTEDLDQNGRWLQDPTYGQVWAPTVDPDWAPYRNGNWVWGDYYGWTWVSSDPWGWAPYHYGRWFHGNAGWCWYPGAIGPHYYWSPALVAFFGFGGFHGGFGLGFGFGNVGWVALAPFEPFHGWWGRGYNRTTIINNTRIVNNTNIAGMYRNARVGNGITGVSSADFGRRGGRFATVSGNEIRSAGLVRGALPVAPNRSSLRFSDRAVNTARFPQTANQRFFTRGATPAAAGQRTPIEQQQRSLGAQAGRSFAGTPQANTGVRSNAAAGAPNRPSGSSWEKFTGPGQTSNRDRGASYTSRPQGSFGAGAGWRTTGPAGASGSSSSPRQSSPGYEAPQRSYQQARPSYEAPQRSYQQARPSYEAPRSYASPRSSEPSRSYGSSGQSVRISPPIVRNYSGSSGNSGGSSRGSSAPSYRSAPSSHSSGGNSGGGASHSNGGGGSHSSGGGGHHGR